MKPVISRDIKFIEEWMETAQNKSVLIQFLSNFIVFNYIYSAYKKPNDTDTKRILECISDYKSRINKEYYHDSQYPELSKKIFDESLGKIYPPINEKTEDKDNELFLHIYHVRCNLFHGAKSLNNNRDDVLLKESIQVLIQFNNDVLELWKNKIIHTKCEVKTCPDK